MKREAALVYDVFIEPAGDRFRITWLDAKKKNRESFTNALSISEEEVSTLWEKAPNQLAIGQALFHFMEGGKDDRHFSCALDRASKLMKKLQINLHTCKEAADWPFELVAKDREFLLLERVHLVRRVSDRGIESKVSPRDRSLRLLFMACDPIDLESGLDYSQEEEAILEITRNLPIQMEVEDSGSLAGLRQRLVLKHYDIVHLSGHANIDNHRPFFKMEGDTGRNVSVYPDQLWNEALIENPPRLLFLSGCRSGQTAHTDGIDQVVSFARLMVEEFRIPAVLGWGHSVRDKLSSHGEKILYYELSRGRSIPEAVRLARCEMQKESLHQDEPAWPILRLYSNGTPLKTLVTSSKHQKPKHRQTIHTYLKHSPVKVLEDGFIGHRRQIQLSIETLNEDYNKTGVLLLGTGGLGKSCLAGKICERFPHHTVIAFQGKLGDGSLEAVLRKVFSSTGDEKGLEILKRKIAMTDKLADLCATSFKERNYILLLDSFEQNLELLDSGMPGQLPDETAELLYTLLYYLPYCGKMSHLVITSRFCFTLPQQEPDMVKTRLQKVWLTSFRESEVRRKVQELNHIRNLENLLRNDRLRNAGYGNPFLMEQIDQIAGQIPANEINRLQEEIENTRENFLRQLGLDQLYRKCSAPLKRILRELRIYDRPVTKHQIPRIEEVTGIKGVKDLLQEGMNLGLVEHDQANSTYSLNPLLREILQ